MHSRSARVSTSVSKALARLNWTVSAAVVSGTAWHCTHVMECAGGGVIGKDHGVDVRNPATGEVLTTIEGLTAEQTDAAIVRAAAAFEEWRGWEAGNVRDVIEFYAGAPERHSGRQIPVPGGLDVTFHEPLGVVGIIVPWNFPMAIAGWGFAPALAAGNTVVLKPAELTPLSALRIGELAHEAGIPEGVLQILPGKGSVVGQRFVDHPAVR